MKDFPNGIRACRKRAGLTMTELAERADTSRNQIYKLEVGERQLTLDWIHRLAPAIGCRKEELLSLPCQDRMPQLPENAYRIEKHGHYLVLRLNEPTEIYLSLHPLFASIESSE
jgi:transcriptional regulator with XRE-family HTH domain